MWDQVQKKIKKASDRVMNAMYSKISSVIKEDNVVYVKISEDEEIRDVRIVTPFGFYSLPNINTFGQVIFNNSVKKAVLVGVEDLESKPVELDIGEVLIYRPGGTSYIHLKNDDTISFGGSKSVARVDDSVEIVIDGTTYTGKITSGSSKLKA
jgi:phage gp45-like